MEDTQIFNEDSRELSKFINNDTVDFVVFSPPYWKLRDYGFKEQIGFKQSYDKYLEDMKKVFSECYKVLKNGRYMAINIGTVVSNEGMKFISGDFINKCQEIGFVFRKDIIWHKPRGTTKWQRGATQFSQNPYPLMFNTNINHEFILIFQKGESTPFDFSKTPKFNRQFIRKMAYSVWDIIPVSSPKNNEKHVAPYPEELPKRLIQLFSFPNEIILDPFAGSGTTNKVAKELGRKSIAFELSKEYCKLIENKINSVNYDSYSKEIYNQDKDYTIELASEKLEKAKKEYIKAKKEYEKLIEKDNKNKGLSKFI
jgi:DNA modification methylase